MQKGQTGIFIRTDNTVVPATATRVRGGNQVDIDVSGLILQMVPVGTDVGHFQPHGFEVEDAPPPKALARLVPRYIPTWHAIVLGVPVAAGTAALFELLWHLLGRMP